MKTNHSSLPGVIVLLLLVFIVVGVAVTVAEAVPATAEENGDWVEIGSGSASGGGISANNGESSGPTLAIKPDGTPIIAWSDNSSGNSAIYVRRWDGSTWVEMGSGSASGGGISPVGVDARYPSLAISPDGTPIIAWQDYSSGNWDIYVRRWNGTTWTPIGSGPASDAGSSAQFGSHDASLSISPDGTPIIAWTDLLGAGGPAEIYVRRWNGTTWVEMGGGPLPGIDPATDIALSPSLAISSDGTPIIAWHYRNDNEGYEGIWVRRWDGLAWVEMGSGSASGGGISSNGIVEHPSLAIDPYGTPIIAWMWHGYSGGGMNIHVRRWDGTAWVEMGSGSATGGGISDNDGYSAHPSLAIGPDGTPIISWNDRWALPGGDYAIYVRRWDGAAWVEMGGGSATGGGIGGNGSYFPAPSLAISPDGTPSIAWGDDSSGNWEIYVRRYLSGHDSPSNVQASDGTYLDKVHISWNSVPNATYYEVYRASTATGDKTKLGSATGTTFDDTTATAGITYFYWVTACYADGCSGYSGSDSGWSVDPSAPKAWTFMLYLAGDTGGIDSGNVHSALARAIQRLEQNPNPYVNVVALLDGPNTVDTFRVTFSPQAEYQALGEKRMDDPATLVEFVQQAQTDFPADHYYLVVADHANGVQGIAWDTTTDPSRRAMLTPSEIRQALVTITENGTQPLDIVHYDGCSFGLLENAAIGQGVALNMIASQNIGWSVFAYSDYRDAVSSEMLPSDLAISIAQRYMEKVDLQQYPYTISALDLGRLEHVFPALDTFSSALTGFAQVNQGNRTLLHNVRSQSQKFDSGGEPYLTIDNEDKYVDLVDFATRVKLQAGSHGIPTAVDNLVETITGSQPLVLYEAHRSGSFDYAGDIYSWNLGGAKGVSIYYPPRAAGATFGDYTSGLTFPNFHSQVGWHSYLQAGLPPLGPGDPLPDDGPDPLSPLFLPRTDSFLPMIVR